MAKVIINDSSDKEKKIAEKAYEKGINWNDKEFNELYQEWYRVRYARKGNMMENSPEAFQVFCKMHNRKNGGKAMMEKVIKDSSFADQLRKAIINKEKF